MSNPKTVRTVQGEKGTENVQTETVPDFMYGITTETVQDEKQDFSVIRKELTEKFGNVTSPKIRYLRFVRNYSRTDTKDILGIRYQHVRNVELMPLKRDLS